MKLLRWLVLVPLLALVAWWFLGGELATEDPRPGASVAEVPAEVAARELVAPVDVGESAAREPTAVDASAAPSKAGAGLVPLTVRERAGARAVPGATVRVLGLGGPGELTREECRDFARAVAELEARGARYTSDAEGRVSLPRAKGEALLSARAGELFGILRFRENAKELVVELAPSGDLEVLVRDDLGRGVGGVPLALGAANTYLFSHQEYAGALTGADGRATLRDARAFVAGRAGSAVALRADVVATRRFERELSFAAWPVEPVVFDLPALGAVEVRVLDAAGSPISGAAAVELVALRAGDDTEGQRRSRMFVDGSTRDAVEGIARFEHVEVSSTVFASTDGAGAGLVTSSSVSDGPRFAGESTTIELRAGASVAVLHGRVLDEGGTPLAGGVQFDLSIRAGGVHGASSGSLDTDQRGEFRVEVPATSGEPAVRTLVLRNRRTRFDEPLATAERSFDGDLAPGVHEVGDFVLASQPVLAGGRVLDDLGRPIARALVTVRTASAPGARRPWSDEHAASGYSAEDGRFLLSGTAATSTLGLDAEERGHVRFETLAIAAGARDLEVVLTRGASVRGEVVVDDGLPLADVIVRAVLGSEAKDGWRHQGLPLPLPVPGRGTFSIQALPAGRASVEFSVRNGPVLVRLDGVELVAGEACADPRLLEVDLRGLAKALHVVVRDESGEGISHSVVRARGRDGSTAWSRIQTDDGHATVRARALPIDFVLGASGYRTQRVDGATADFEVTLARGLAVELVLDPESLAALGPDATLAVEYERGELTGPDDSIAWPELAEPDERGLARVHVCEPGRFRVEVRASRRRDGRNDAFSAPCEPATIEVRDRAEPQRFELRVPDATRAGLGEFRRP